jgi:hypothetical protein
MLERRKVTFPVIGDDEVLQQDTRVILTNQQLITRNPSLQDEAMIGSSDAPKTAAKRPDTFKPYKPKTSFSTQHRPLNSNHSGVSSYDKMPKKTSIDESKERAKRAAATLPKPVKQYVSPLERDKEDFSVRRSSTAILNKRPVKNDNPIQEMKKQGMNLSDALGKGSPVMKKSVPHGANLTDVQKGSYFENKRKNIFDRGIV